MQIWTVTTRNERGFIVNTWLIPANTLVEAAAKAQKKLDRSPRLYERVNLDNIGRISGEYIGK
jgi:hypothetical protein